MPHVLPLVSRAGAEKFFQRPQWRNLFGVRRGHPAIPAVKNPDGSPTLPWLECVWLPHYRIDIEGHYAKRTGRLGASLEAWSGAFAFFQLHDALREGPPPGLHFPPGMAEDVAVRVARREMLRNIMRRRGQREKPVLGKTLDVSLSTTRSGSCISAAAAASISVFKTPTPANAAATATAPAC